MEKDTIREGDLKHYIKVIRRRWWIILIFIGVFIITGILYFFLSAPLYIASSSFMVGANESLFTTGYSRITIEDEIKNHLHLIKTEPVLRRTSEYFSEDELKRMNFKNPREVYSRLKSGLSSGRINIDVEGESRIIKVSVMDINPHRSSLLANQITKSYRDFNTEISSGEAHSTRTFVEEQLKSVKEALNKSEESLKKFKEEHGILGVTEEVRNFVSQMGGIETEYRRAKLDAETTRRKLESVRSRLSDRQQTLLTEASETSFQILDGLKAQLAVLERDRADFLIRGFPSNDERVTRTEASINSIKQKMNEIVKSLLSEQGMMDPLDDMRDLLQQSLTLKVDYDVAKTKEDALQAVLSSYQQELQRIPLRDLQLARLEREKLANEKLYLMLMEKKQQSEIEEASVMGNISIISLSNPPENPNVSTKIKNVFIIIFMGLILGLAAGFVVDYMDTAIQDSEEVVRITGMSKLATIPLIEMNKCRTPLMIDENCDYHIGESIRKLRTSIKLSQASAIPSPVLVTGPNAGTGKTMVAVNLAYSFASSGARVLLIDTDLRRPAIRKYLDIKEKIGLSDILIEDQFVKPVDISGMDVIISGSETDKNPAELLDSDKMRNILVEWKEQYDLVILDSPPLLMVSDGVILGSMSGGTIMVISYGETTRDVTRQATEELKQLSIRILGFVFNKAPITEKASYYGYYNNNNQENAKKV